MAVAFAGEANANGVAAATVPSAVNKVRRCRDTMRVFIKFSVVLIGEESFAVP